MKLVQRTLVSGAATDMIFLGHCDAKEEKDGKDL